jgi:hypothetical protein
MSKKKNTLKDLDEFLKQQAATLVTPSTLTTSSPETSTGQGSTSESTLSFDKVLEDLQMLAKNEGHVFRPKLYELIIKTLENQDKPMPVDTMLINTALYLKHGENWKDGISHYWQKRAE